MPDVTQSTEQNIAPDQNILARIAQVLKAAAPAFGAFRGGGGAPQSIPASGGNIGAGAMPPPVPMGFPGGARPGMSAAPGAGMPAALPPSAPQQRPQMGGQIPTEYRSPEGRTGAVVSGAISSLSQFVSNFAKERMEKRQTGAESAAYTLLLKGGGKLPQGIALDDKKSSTIVKTLQAFMSGDPEAIMKASGTPEGRGVQAAIAKYTQMAQAEEERKALSAKQGEELRSLRAKATADEAAAARAPEVVQAGLDLTKAQAAEMGGKDIEARAHAKYLTTQAATPHEVDFSKLTHLGGEFKKLGELGPLPTQAADAIITSIYTRMNEDEKRRVEVLENAKKNTLARDLTKMRFATGFSQATPETQKDMVDNAIRGLTEPNGYRMWNILVGRDAKLADATRQRLAELKITPEQFTQSTIQLAETSREIVPLLWDLSGSLDPKSKNYGRIAGKLGTFKGRFNEFLRTLGPADPDFSALATAMSMSASGTTRAHMGARGGFGMTARFDKLFASGHLTPEALKSQVDAVAWFLARAYADSVYHEGSWEPERYRGRSRPKAPLGMPNSWDVPAGAALPVAAPAENLSDLVPGLAP